MSLLKKLTEADDEQFDLDVGGDEEGEGGDVGAEPEGKTGTLNITVKGLKLSPEDLEGATVELENDGEEGEDEEGDLDLDGLDVGDEGGEEEDEHKDEEKDELTDESVLDIDESVLVKEVNRMKKLREGDASGKKVLGDFGGGKDDGDPWLDHDIEDLNVDESEEADDDEEDMKEDEKDTKDGEACSEAVRHERVLQKLYRSRVSRIRESIKSAKTISEKHELTRRLSRSINSLKESRKRLMRNIIEESKSRNRKAAVNETHKTNKAATRKSNTSAQLSERKVQELQKELDEQKLQNAKLIYTTKLLQNESLNSRQKATVIDRLDEAKSVREVRMTYETVTKAIAAKRHERLSEGKVIGSSSQAVRSSSSSASLNESSNYEASRWAKLAGIK